MGGTIIHTQSKDFIPGQGTREPPAAMVQRSGNRDNRPDYEQFLHWIVETKTKEFLKRQSGTVEALITVLIKTLDSKKGRYGLSLNSADSIAREAGFAGGKEVTEAVDRAGPCLVSRTSEQYMFKGNLVLAKRL